MKNYNINIYKIKNNNNQKHNKSEIWAKITNKITNISIEKRILWIDENGIINDESVKLPPNIRDLVDNVWIERCKKW
jgi:hypothetical protein